MKVGDLAANRAIVNDHAIIRFLERVYGLDVEAVRAAIVEATAAGREAAAPLGDAQFAIVIERIRFVVERGEVMTALGDGMRFCPTGYRRGARPSR